MAYQHKDLAAGRWQELSLAEQLGNIGGEVSRMLNWQGRDARIFEGAFERALELFDLSLADQRWRGRLKEIARAREVLCDAYFDGKEFGTKLEDLQNFFLNFALAARKQGKLYHSHA